MTANRPQALARALDSYARLSALARGPFTITVFDDSEGQPAILNREIAAAARRTHGLRILFAGRAERADFARVLIARGCSADVVEFGLFGESWPDRTAGANRNAAFLANAGHPFLSVDDDTECEAMSPADVDAGVAFVAVDRDSADPVSPCRLWTFSNRTALRRSLTTNSLNVLARHEEILGWDIDDFLARAPSQVTAAAQSHVSPGGRVVVTLNGLAGDCGWRSPTHYLWTTGESFAALTSSDEDYAAACCSREVLRACTMLTVADGATNMMSTFFGVDARWPLCPFPPIGRGQDVVFGLLVTTCVPAARFAHLPWALLHSPVESRAFRRGEIVAGALGIDLCVLMAACIAAASHESSERDRSLDIRCLGAWLERIGRMPQTDAAAVLRRTVCTTVTRHFESLDQRARQPGAPRSWAQDARNAVRAQAAASRLPSYHIPVECMRGAGIEEATTRTVSYVRQLGRLLQEWPDMFAVSRELNEQGMRMAVPV